MKRIFLLVPVIVSLIFSSGYRSFSGKPRSVDSLLNKLRAEKANNDEYYRTHGDDLISFAKIPGVDSLLEIENEWPDKYDYDYNVLKDDDGKIIHIDQISSHENPYTLHLYTHYFDQMGNTYAFEKKEVMYFDGDKPKLVLDDQVIYYNKDFKILNKTDTVMDSGRQPIKITQEESNKMNFKCDIYKDLSSCLKGYGIALKE